MRFMICSFRAPVDKFVVFIVSCLLGVALLSASVANAQEDAQNDKPAKKKSYSMSSRVGKLVLEAQELASPEEESAEPDFAGALVKLQEAEALKDLSDYEKAQLQYFYGFVFYSQEKYNKSIAAYQKVISYSDIPDSLRDPATYTLAQLKFTTEKYQEAIDLLNDWLKTQESPGPDPYVLIGTGYYQLGEIDKVIPPLEKAMAIARERGTEPKEQWWLLLRVAYWEKGDNKKVKEILEILVTNWPKKEYWSQLSAVYGELEEEPKQFFAYASAYDQGLLTKNAELLQMAQLFLANEVPYKAAKVLEKGFADEIVETNAKNLRLYSQAWALSREDRKAIAPLKQAAKLSEDGELDIRLAQSYLNLSEYKSCVSAARTGLKKGDLKRADIGNVILGMCLFETDDLANAKAAFRKASKDERSEKNAKNWIKFIKSEEDRIERQEQALRDLAAPI
jgi:hypothetical protein